MPASRVGFVILPPDATGIDETQQAHGCREEVGTKSSQLKSRLKVTPGHCVAVEACLPETPQGSFTIENLSLIEREVTEVDSPSYPTRKGKGRPFGEGIEQRN